MTKEEQGNTLQYEIGSEHFDIGGLLYRYADILQARFPYSCGKFVVTIEFYPEGENNE